MTEFIGMCALTAVCSSAILLISKSEKELSMLISSAIYILVMLYVISRTGELLNTLNDSFNLQGIFPNISVLLKTGGIAIVCAITSSICDSVGQKGLAAAVDIFAVIEIIWISLPLISDLFSYVLKLLGE